MSKIAMLEDERLKLLETVDTMQSDNQRVCVKYECSVCVFEFMCDESRSARQVHSNTNQDNSFFKGKKSCPGWDSNPRHSAFVVCVCMCMCVYLSVCVANFNPFPTSRSGSLYRRQWEIWRVRICN